MRQVNGKPPKWQWIASAGLILAGLLLQIPTVPDLLRERLSPALFMSGFIVLLVLFRRKEKYDDLPLEDQKEQDRMDRDERNQMVYEKTAWNCWRGETVLFFTVLILFFLFADKIPLFQAVDSRTFSHVISLVMLLYWIRILIFELVRWWMNRKY